FATWAGSLLDGTHPIVIIAEPGREQEAATRLGRVGFDNVAGYLDGGMSALGSRSDLISRTQRVTAASLAEQLASAAPPLILDVRGAKEWEAARISGSLNIPLTHLEEQITQVPRGRRIAVHCASGYRSAIAASLLARHGITDVEDLVGGIAAWEAARNQTVVHPG
ncbi:MAG TPA: rhodanese-like domain-containing protein, partial [Patescibacteria group bacterium]|nr:rhodanese-like domain-containing protein [Patescibacteria group bacterium]